MVKKLVNAFRAKKDRTKYSRPSGAGNFDNMDDFNIVDSIDVNTGTIQHTPVNNKDLVNKEYVDTLGAITNLDGGRSDETFIAVGMSPIDGGDST